MKILLTGQTGQLGQLLAPALAKHATLISVTRKQMDLEDLNQIREIIRATKPDLIINPAAYTAVVKAETDIARATRINAEAPEVIAQEAQRLGAGMIHYSTDYVFDGAQRQPYTEEDMPNPLNVYGQSKYAGELAVAQHCEAHWILRTSWVYSVAGANFLKTVIRLAQANETFTIADDQFGAPTWAHTLSDITISALLGKKNKFDLDHIRNTAGRYHVTASGETSWHLYARFIVDQLLQLGVPLTIKDSSAVMPVSTTLQPGMPKRPASSRLDGHKFATAFGLAMPQWQTDVAQCLQQIVSQYDLVNGQLLP